MKSPKLFAATAIALLGGLGAAHASTVPVVGTWSLSYTALYGPSSEVSFSGEYGSGNINLRVSPLALLRRRPTFLLLTLLARAPGLV